MSRSHYRDDSLSEAVFSEEESGYHDVFSPKLSQVFSPNFSMTSLRDFYSPQASTRDVYSPQVSNRDIYSASNCDVYSPQVSNRDAHSPTVSSYSTYSQEVKYIFDPNFGNIYNNNQAPMNMEKVQTPSVHSDYDPAGESINEDYSQIQFSHKKSNLQRKHSNSSLYSNRSQGHHPVGQGHIMKNGHHVMPPPPPPRTSSSASTSHLPQQGDATLTPRHKPTLMHSMSTSYSSGYYYPYNQSRRKTWSPDGLKLGYATTNVKQDHRLRSYSNDQLVEQIVHENRDHIYEELETGGPPRIAPVSGILTKSPGRGIIKPIAFKPVVANQKYVSPQKSYGDHPRKYSHLDDGYGSQDYGVAGHNGVANMSHGSFSSTMECDRSTSFSSECNRISDRSDSVPVSHISRHSSNHMECYGQTPSPSDSGVGELEAILKEKDAEINTLRDVMDKNERAIFQVYEDKKSGWIREIELIKDDYENKLKTLQRKTYKSEQVLNLQVFKLQQEKKAMQEDVEKTTTEKEDLVQKCEAYAEETNRLQAQMDDATWQGRRPAGEVSELQTQVDNLQSKLTSKSEEVIRLQSKLDEANANMDTQHQLRSSNLSRGSLQRLNTSGSDNEPDIPLCHCEKEIQTDFIKSKTPEMETLKPSLICEKDKELSSLKEELDKIRLEILVNKEEYEKEKEQWLEEKNKVIMYQKQLQLNYVQMFRKNKVLEAEVEQLTLELESRDMKLMALNGEESVC